MRIHDFASFHDVFAHRFGFYGRNLNAWLGGIWHCHPWGTRRGESNVELLDIEEIRLTPPPLALSSEQRKVLDHLCLYHQKGLSPHRAPVKSWRIVLFLACCFAVSAGLILFPNLVPSFFSTLLAGFFAGSLLTATRYRLASQRQWPLLEATIDWKLADRMQRDAGMLSDHAG